MNIVFWSEDDGCGTTTGMAAVASVCANAWKLRTVLMQSRNQEGDLRKKLQPLPITGMVREESSYYALDGLDYLLWQEKNNRLDHAMVRGSMVPVIGERMYFLPQGERKKPQLCPQELGASMHRIVQEAEQLSDLTFVDCGCGEDTLADSLLAQADVVVVNFSQERQCLDSYFEKRHAYRGRVIYIVNQYQPESVYNKKNLNRIYRLKEGELGVIPHNPLFRHACDKGQAERFVRRHLKGAAFEAQHYFMEELMQTALLILKAAGYA